MNQLNTFGSRSKVAPINIEAYLKRIGEKREMPSIGFLRKLHRSHMLNVPFENLDIHYRNKITIDYARIYRKVVENGRGGFCFELNGLFYHLLYHLGFDCYLISARVRKEEVYGPQFDHMAIVIKLENEYWLVDVGFRNSYLYPKKIVVNEVQMDYIDYWRIVKDPDENFILQQSNDSTVFYSKYLFTLEERYPIEFIGRCEHHQTSRESQFTQQKLITMVTEKGRVTLTNKKLRINALGKTEETDISNEEEFLSKLQHYFNIGFEQLTPLK